ncbi:protein prenyltransferase alpha subunit repeat-containing protein 1 [Trichoderma asperellum]|uniref:Protein prenyltransferase alpha subunit repeat-containing protein 1 n=1 Tax=Trichoderma asperellum TaxID=101201 RepID=A0A6V8R2S1_TRIAP|nr:protein prenyltransferase alpha subunit repeat-containing protein 1 [Trichoderma asperellum]
MSRALDDDVKRAIKHGDHEQIFTKIADALSQRHAELLEIELLGRSHMADAGTILLQDGPAIAVPKLRLVQAFIFARALLYKGKDVSRATAVMLLMDPEHLTAANTRKRLLQDAIKSGTDVEARIRDELYFVDSLLTSRLHRHTKSPTLWGHRQWLMQRFQERGLKIDATSIMTAVISVAAERHPRNYYAWLHARYLTNAVSETAASRDKDKDKDEDKDKDKDLAGMLEAAKNWAVRHHDDISGWAFLMFFLDRHPEYAGPVVRETTRLAASFHWRNESVWYFLRNISARAWCDRDWREGVEATRLALLGGAERGSDGERILEQAASWIQAYSE